jgi:trans-aconitate 2-methyltransferase
MLWTETPGMATWDPSSYLRHAEERSRPFAELLDRIDVDATSVADLGCGPGHLMPLLRHRWPGAALLGVDSSTEMLDTANAEHAGDGVTYEQADVRAWTPDEPVDVIVTNATLQWVPNHLPLLGRWQHYARSALALSVPGNHDERSHVLLRELAGHPPYAEYAAEVEHPNAHDAETYLEVLAAPGWQVDAWETTYLHVLSGPDPVLSWISGTGARPVLQALPDALREEFRAEYGAALREAYPARSYGTVLPFRRVFAVAART